LPHQIFFNEARWPEIIESQRRIISMAIAQRASNFFLEDHHTINSDLRYLNLTSSELELPMKVGLSNRVCGYDLPCSFSGKDWNGRYLLFCFQDPLRTKEAKMGIAGVLAGIPFGLASNRMRLKRMGYGVVWATVLAAIEAGFGVWVTDARKFWVDPNNPLPPEDESELTKIQQETLADEIRLLKPEKVFSFGDHANNALRDLGVKVSSCQLHPSVRGNKPWQRRYQEDIFDVATNADERMTAKVNAYLKDMGIGCR